MSRNEGLLSKHHFEGEVAHTGDHPPVFRWGVPADSCPAMGAGMLLTAADGKISPSNGSGAIVGVLDEPFEAGDASLKYLAHGTVKLAMLKVSGGDAPDASALAALEAAGIYPV